MKGFSMSPRKSRREAMLDAAAELVHQNGAAHLTLDAVCVKANVSKGGLLYHFPTKEDLLRAMATRLIDTMNSIKQKEMEKLPPSRAKLLKAHLLSMEYLWSERVRPIASALLAVGANDPGLLKSVGEAQRKMLREMEESGLSPAFIRIATFAVLGLHLSEMLGLGPYSGAERKAFLDELLDLVNEKEACLAN